MAIKKSRFTAAFKGLTSIVKEHNRRSIINNILKANELANESDLIALTEKKSELVVKLATCTDAEVKDVITSLCSLIEEEKAIKSSIEYSKLINDLLDEEIEVEDK